MNRRGGVVWCGVGTLVVARVALTSDDEAI